MKPHNCSDSFVYLFLSGKPSCLLQVPSEKVRASKKAKSAKTGKITAKAVNITAKAQ